VTTVVLAASLGTTSELWEGQLPALTGYRVVLCEHPNERTIEACAEDVLQRVDADRFAFVGVSLGGAIGMQLALDAPDRVDRLVLSCTSARFNTPEFWEQRAATVRAQGVESIADVVLQRWFTPEFPDVRRYREMLTTTPAEKYARCCEALRDWDARGKLGAVDAPTLVVAGADDPATPPADAEAIAAEIPDSRLVVLERARHLANVERPAEFNAALTEHLAV
jgi:3-oxoadipate enol-lactonase